MKKFKFNKISIIVLAIAFVFGAIGIVKAYTNPSPVTLGTASSFAVLAGSGITDSNPSVIIGDAGSYSTPTNNLPNGEVTGTNYTTSNATVSAAKVALKAAYTDVSTRSPDSTYTPVHDLGGETLGPGIYNDSSSFAITGTLTLDGGNNPNAIFIFQAGSTLTTATSSNVSLINGAQACNVYWQVGSDASLGTTSNFSGTIMALTSITDAGGSIVNGRLLADAENNGTGAVTLNNTTVTVPTCAPHLTLVKEVDNNGVGTATANEWTLTASGSSGAWTLLSGLGPIVDSDVAYPSANFAAATHTLSESGPSGYTASDWVCTGGGTQIGSDITVNRGDNVTCTITNTFIIPSVQGTLNVTKNVVNTGGGTKDPSDFMMSIHAFNPTQDISFPGDDGGTSTTLDIGAYSVTETGPTGYTSSGNCSGTITDGVISDCTITNTYVPPVRNSSVIGSIARAVVSFFDFEPTITILSTPVVVDSIIPKLPKTGFAPQESDTWYQSLLNNILNLFR